MSVNKSMKQMFWERERAMKRAQEQAMFGYNNVIQGLQGNALHAAEVQRRLLIATPLGWLDHQIASVRARAK